MNFVPEFLPLHPDVSREFHGLGLKPCGDVIKDIEDQFIGTLTQMVKEMPEDQAKDIIKMLEEQYEQLLMIYSQMESQRTLLQKAKVEYKQKSEECAPVTLENWDQYRLKSLTAPSLEHTYRELKSNERSLPKTPSDNQMRQLFFALPYIWENPTAMIPDNANEAQEEEELRFSGGNIELTCPISFQPFTKPMISRKCGHVFDKPALERFLQKETKTCPQAACGQHVSIKDFVPDLIMQFRCLISEVRGPQTRNNTSDQGNVVD
ncbi:HDL124Cp [Eremothecium sinecaudum]|uniref:HDL124Cp n=1 Tax=Eremothecium sinecaudum TaxID=45286 RepID=A0A0X8HSF0_9SACH|nr:HDL124Cp [Eremothecium sinecaudum]AMD20620.1 HDL124Cp [Eremothecium sinecaudum]